MSNPLTLPPFFPLYLIRALFTVRGDSDYKVKHGRDCHGHGVVTKESSGQRDGTGKETGYGLGGREIRLADQASVVMVAAVTVVIKAKTNLAAPTPKLAAAAFLFFAVADKLPDVCPARKNLVSASSLLIFGTSSTTHQPGCCR